MNVSAQIDELDREGYAAYRRDQYSHAALLFERARALAIDAGDHAADLFGVQAQREQVVAEQLDGDRRARAGEQVIDAVRDRLADRERGAWYAAERAAQLVEEGLA